MLRDAADPASTVPSVAVDSPFGSDPRSEFRFNV
jgi:hypothetical protein